MGIPNYLGVISVIDHHKSALTTPVPSMAILSDVQSSNTLVAMRAFEINDSNRKKPHYIHPTREYIEYLHFLYGIIDDTDLLSKVSPIDVQCVASLLNRLKGKTIIDLSDLSRDKNFAKVAAKRILQNEEMYSLYRKVYQYREGEIDRNISACAKGEASNFFADTKVQNGCCRVGQTKMFASNWSHFVKNAPSIEELSPTKGRDSPTAKGRQVPCRKSIVSSANSAVNGRDCARAAVQKMWLKKAMQIHQEKPEIDLHIHMISTIVGAEEVYKGVEGKYEHLDEMWIWIPNQELAVEHLKRFLSHFQHSPGLKGGPLQLDLLGSNQEELSLIFKESFFEIAHKKMKKELPIAVLKYKAGALNSRKAMVSPFLPQG
jgi:hypothetical protein